MSIRTMFFKRQDSLRRAAATRPWRLLETSRTPLQIIASRTPWSSSHQRRPRASAAKVLVAMERRSSRKANGWPVEPLVTHASWGWRPLRSKKRS